MKPGAHPRYLNRELSWLEFNQRVLEEARDPDNPLLERVKFFCIFSSNLDEFFEVRVAGLKQQTEGGAAERSPDGLTPTENLRAITRRVRRMVQEQSACWREELVPALARHGVRFLAPATLEGEDRRWVESFYRAEVRPVLTPLGVDPTHPFPQLLNKSLNLVVRLETTVNGLPRQRLAVVQVPRLLPRLIRLPREDGRQDYVFLEHLIGGYLADLFPGTPLQGHWTFRLTRNSELYIDEEEVANLLKAVETQLLNRRRGEVVRLEVESDCPPDIRAELLETLGLTDDDLYALGSPLNPGRLMVICEGDHSPELRDPPFLAPTAAALRHQADLFAVMRERDVLLHHPYESFDSVVAFLRQAASDPRVLAIKQTLYRTGGDPRIIGALMDAVANDKQVTAVVELKARFDEANNIEWARRLEDFGVHVVYGLVGYKVHGKITLVVRRDDDGLRRYVHLSTGNYNPATARLYTDVGLLTCHPDFGEDATTLFNLLTGICHFQGMRKFLLAPFELHRRLVALVRRESAHAQRGLPARVIAKMNSLVDTDLIDALYEASQAGVQIDLVVRGICCLRPRVRGLSENIRVRSLVGRFLEHSRLFYFENACQPEVWAGSADWMPRNFFRRIEILFPIEDGNLRDRVATELLGVALTDTVKARLMQPDGSYRRPAPQRGVPPRNAHAELMARALQAARGEPNGRAPATPYPKLTPAPRPSRRGA